MFVSGAPSTPRRLLWARRHASLIGVGFSEDLRKAWYGMFCAAASVGNCNFSPEGQGSKVSDQFALKTAAEILQVDAKMLEAAITSRTMGGGVVEVYQKPLEPKLAEVARNSLVGHVYQLAFDWAVDVINDYIAASRFHTAVGILDIFGFENFALNSFPQLCINFTNESLHNLFIEYVFKLEQEIYVREEVDWQFVEYEDNQHTLDLISKRPHCVYGLLDEGCATGSGTDSSVLGMFHSSFTDSKGKHKSYIKPKKASDRTFVLVHYAGEVVYTIEGFVEKNKDELSTDINELLTTHCKNETLADLCRKDIEKKADADAAKAAGKKKKGGGGKKKKTVSKSFQESLEALMTKLRSTEHHYIRCLKPNQTLKPGDWDDDFMTSQLAYSGTLEVTQIRQAGLNVRRPLQHFFFYYKVCAEDQAAILAGTVTERTKELLHQCKLNTEQYRVGKTLVFLKTYELLEQLDKLREVKIVEYVIILQSFFRMIKDMRAYWRVQAAVRKIQGFQQSRLVRAAYLDCRAAAAVIQRRARTVVLKKAYRGAQLQMEIADPPLDHEARAALIVRSLRVVQKPPGPGQTWGGRGYSDDDDDKKKDGGKARTAAPQFRTELRGWLNVSEDGGERQKAYAVLRLGTLSLFEDETLMDDLHSLYLPDYEVSDEKAPDPSAVDEGQPTHWVVLSRHGTLLGEQWHLHGGGDHADFRPELRPAATLEVGEDHNHRGSKAARMLTRKKSKKAANAGAGTMRGGTGAGTMRQGPGGPGGGMTGRAPPVGRGSVAPVGAGGARPGGQRPGMAERPGRPDKKERPGGGGMTGRAAPAGGNLTGRGGGGMTGRGGKEGGGMTKRGGFGSKKKLDALGEDAQEGAEEEAKAEEEVHRFTVDVDGLKKQGQGTWKDDVGHVASLEAWKHQFEEAKGEAKAINEFKLPNPLAFEEGHAAVQELDPDQEAVTVVKEGYLRKKEVDIPSLHHKSRGGEGHDSVEAQASRRRSEAKGGKDKRKSRRPPKGGSGGGGDSELSTLMDESTNGDSSMADGAVQFGEAKNGEITVDPWGQCFVCLTNDGKLTFYEDMTKSWRLGCIDLKGVAVEMCEKLDDDFDLRQKLEEANIADEEMVGIGCCGFMGGSQTTLQKMRAEQKKKVEEETITGGKLCSVVEGKQFQLCAGQSVHRFASPSPDLSEAWVHALRMEAVFNYQLCPIFPQDRVVVHSLDRRAFECPIKPHTKARDVLRHTIEVLGLHKEEAEWALHEVWDHGGLPRGERERRLPPLEAILDVTLLAWEAAHRKRHGMVAVAPPNCFKVELRRVAMTQPSTTKIDASLEFAQALSDLKAGRVPCANEQELVDLAALAALGDLGDTYRFAFHDDPLAEATTRTALGKDTSALRVFTLGQQQKHKETYGGATKKGGGGMTNRGGGAKSSGGGSTSRGGGNSGGMSHRPGPPGLGNLGNLGKSGRVSAGEGGGGGGGLTTRGKPETVLLGQLKGEEDKGTPLADRISDSCLLYLPIAITGLNPDGSTAARDLLAAASAADASKSMLEQSSSVVEASGTETSSVEESAAGVSGKGRKGKGGKKGNKPGLSSGGGSSSGSNGTLAPKTKTKDYWATQVGGALKELTQSEIVLSRNLTQLRRLVGIFRRDSKLEDNAIAARRIVVDRVHRAPHCFCADFECELWSGEPEKNAESAGAEGAGSKGPAPPPRMKLIAAIDHDGLHLYSPGMPRTLLCTFGFLEQPMVVVSWVKLNEMLVVDVVRSRDATGGGANISADTAMDPRKAKKLEKGVPSEKARRKLHLLTREAGVMAGLLRRYSDTWLAEETLHAKLMPRERARPRGRESETGRDGKKPRKMSVFGVGRVSEGKEDDVTA